MLRRFCGECERLATLDYDADLKRRNTAALQNVAVIQSRLILPCSGCALGVTKPAPSITRCCRRR